MTNNSSSSLALPNRYRWLLGSGLMVGSLLSIFAATLPEHYEDLAVIGIGVIVACIGGILVHFGRSAELRWRGISPAVAMALGALLLLPPAGWRYFESRRGGEVPKTRAAGVQAAQRVRPSSRPTRAAVQPRLEIRAGEVQAAVDSPQSPETAESERDRVLDQVAQVLDRKARPAVALARAGAFMALGHDASAGLKIADAERELADLRSSLAEIRSRNPGIVEVIDQVVGNGTAVRDLDAALGRFGDLLGSHGADRQETTQDLRAQISGVSAWIADCHQRIADLETSAAQTN